MDTLHYVVNDKPTKSSLEKQFKERLTAQFCFLSEEKRNELTKKIKGKYKQISSAQTQMSSSELDIQNSSIQRTSTTVASRDYHTLRSDRRDCDNTKKRSKRPKRSDSLLEIAKYKRREK